MPILEMWKLRLKEHRREAPALSDFRLSLKPCPAPELLLELFLLSCCAQGPAQGSLAWLMCGRKGPQASEAHPRFPGELQG